MKNIVALFLACFAVNLFSQAPPIQRNYFTTNTNPQIFSTTNGGIKYIGPLGGNNGVTDPLTNAPNFTNQVGVSKDAENPGASGYLLMARSLATGDWSFPWSISAGLVNVGLDYPNHHTNSFVDQTTFNFMGNPFAATRSNMLTGSGWKDVGVRNQNWNPYANPYYGVGPVYTVNSNYNFYGRGTHNTMYGTNAEGSRIFKYADFGPVFGMSTPGWLSTAVGGDGNHTNASGEGWIILGGSGEVWGWSISENATYGGQFLQYPMFTIDRRYNTNTAQPLAVRFPKRVAGATVVTNTGWLDTLIIDEINGNVIVPNGSLVVTGASTFISHNTNVGAAVFGDNYEAPVTAFLVNGSGAFAAPSQRNFREYLGLDGVDNHRGPAFVIQNGFTGPKIVTASNGVFILGFSSHPDLVTGADAQTITNWFVADAGTRQARWSNMVSVLQPATTITNMNNTNVAALTVSAAGVNSALVVNAAGNVIASAKVAIGTNDVPTRDGASYGLAVIGGALIARTNLDNVQIGSLAGLYSVGGTLVQLGSFAGQQATNSVQAIQIGRHAGYNSWNSDNVVQIGHAAGQWSSSAASSVHLGYQAARFSTNGFSAVAIGGSAAQNTPSIQNGVIVGYEAGMNGGSASGASQVEATIVGYQAGRNTTSGQQSVMIGNGAGLNATNAQNTIFIGYNAGMRVNRNNTLVIDSSVLWGTNGSNAMIYGEIDTRELRLVNQSVTIKTNAVGIGTTIPLAKLHTSNGVAGVVGERIDQIATNSILQGRVGTAQTLVFAGETNGWANYSTQATNELVATGYTNTTGVNMQAFVTATAVSFTVNNRAGTVLYTSPTLTATVNVGLQPGWSIRGASGLAGTVIPGL